jgi:hypothetical protein
MTGISPDGDGAYFAKAVWPKGQAAFFWLLTKFSQLFRHRR